MKILHILLVALLVPLSAGTASAQVDQPLFTDAARMDGAELAQVAGRDDTSLIVRAQNSSNVSNNSVSGQSQTGTINFDAQSFSSLNGLSLLSANTGNNVSINSSLNVNVAILPR